MRPTRVPTTILVSVLPLLLVLLAACGEDTVSPGGAQSPDQVAGRVFVGDEVTGRQLVAGTTLRLDFTDGLRADAGCNQLGGDGTIADGVLVATISSMTEMGCDRPRMDQDAWVVSFLESRPAATVIGPSLTLAKEGVTVTLTDDEELKARNPIPLEGTTWELESIVRGDTASSVPGGRPPRLSLESGEAKVFTGCNHGSAQVTIDGTTMTFEQLALTQAACQGGLEDAVVGVLRGPVDFEHDHDQLTLASGPDSLVFRAKGGKASATQAP